jgi:radical SAM protein with 4Fe4S-binding SPASM domain
MVERVTHFPSAPDLSDFSSSERDLIPEVGFFRTLSAPITLQWELTPFCNERCVHCYNFWRGPQAGEKLVVSPETLAVYDKSAQEIIRNKVFNITVTGGEPLAVLKHTYPYLQQLAENDVGISFNTNLTMFTRERARMLRSLGVRSILTSLMSGNPDLNDELANRPNTHHDVSRGIRLALDEGFWVAVNMVVTKKNLSDVFSTAEYVKGLGVTAFSATKASTPINSPDFSDYVLSREEFRLMVQELLRIRKDLGLHTDSLEFYPACFFDTQETRDFTGNRMCNAGKTACTIGFDGLVRPCSHASQTYGSILEDGGLKEAWRNLQPWRTEEYIPKGCFDCPAVKLCRGGCRTEAFAVSGNLAGQDPYCNFSYTTLPTTEEKVTDVDFLAKYCFHSGIKTREESFGGILFLTPVKWLGVTKEFYEFYKGNRTKGFFLGDLARVLGLDRNEDVRKTAEILIKKAIIQKGGEDE